MRVTDKLPAICTRLGSHRRSLGGIVAALFLSGGLMAPLSPHAACPGTNLGDAPAGSRGGSGAGAAHLMRGASCGGGGGINAPDATFLYTAPVTGSYTIDTAGSSFDTILSVRSTCAGSELACNDDSG